MKKIIVAIDGYSACGKSTTAKLVAAQLNYAYIDTGAMYRAVTLYFIENHIALTNPKEVTQALRDINISFQPNPKTQRSDTYLNGINVENEIRKMYVTQQVSPVSAITEVRKTLVAEQQKMGKRKGVVMDGRDIGTTVFPEAEVKVFMDADLTVRAHRRQKELMEKGETLNLEEIVHNLKERDRIDTTREESPLRKAADAHYLDTTYMTIDEEVEYVLHLATSRIISLNKSNSTIC
ncbi:MAG: (d)CMP kinase [Thermonemataceae bacterium]